MTTSRRSSSSIRLGDYASGALRGMLLVSAPLALGACDAEPEVDAASFANVRECVADGGLSARECEESFQAAVAEQQATAPRYQSLSDCSADWNQCQPAPAAAGGVSSGGGFFMPFLTGFMVANAIDGLSGRRYSYAPVYRSRDGGYYSGGGAYLPGYGRMRMPASTARAAVQRPATVERYGFGQTRASTGFQPSAVSRQSVRAVASDGRSLSASRVTRGGFGSSGRGYYGG